MDNQIQFVTNEKGEKTGVLLNVEYYYQLVSYAPSNPKILPGLSIGELEALSDMKLALSHQARIDELIARQKADILTVEEVAELDQFLVYMDHLTTLKARAGYTLYNMSKNPTISVNV